MFKITLILFSWFSIQLYSQVYILIDSDLNFGDVFVGYNKTVTDLDAGAARFRVYHNVSPRKDLLISLTLPSTLSNGLNTININFNNSYSAYSFSNSASSRTYFNPYSPLRLNRIRRNLIVYFWLGGTVSNTINASPGIYTGTIIITVEIL